MTQEILGIVITCNQHHTFTTAKKKKRGLSSMESWTFIRVLLFSTFKLMAIIYNTLKYLHFTIYSTKKYFVGGGWKKKNKKDWKQIPCLLQANCYQTGFLCQVHHSWGVKPCFPSKALKVWWWFNSPSTIRASLAQQHATWKENHRPDWRGFMKI